MQVSFLLDENIAAPLADKLDKAGHDVERVVDVSELGEGVDDTMICQYAVEESRLIVTATTTSSNYRPIHTVACSMSPTSRFPRTNSTTSSSELSKRSPIERRWIR